MGWVFCWCNIKREVEQAPDRFRYWVWVLLSLRADQNLQLWSEGIVKGNFMLAMSCLQQGAGPGRSTVPQLCGTYLLTFLEESIFISLKIIMAPLKKGEETLLLKRATCHLIAVR